MVQKHVPFAPANKWGLAPFIPKASLSSAYLRDCFVASLLATPAQPFSRFFTIQLSPSRKSDAVGRRVCLSEASYAAAEKSVGRMALNI